jgi:MFS family permease
MSAGTAVRISSEGTPRNQTTKNQKLLTINSSWPQSSVFGPLSGTILRHFSLKWCYITFFAVFELGSALCGAAQSSAMLIIGRAVAGVGAAGIMSSAMTVLSATVPLEKRPATLGMLMGIAQLGSICGPLVGGAFTTGYTWRWCK